MTIVMDMSSYTVEKPFPARDAVVEHQAWPPTLLQVAQQQSADLIKQYPSLPPSLVYADAEAFLLEMEAYRFR